MDAINKPERRIIGVSISTQIASWVYVMFAIVGFLFSIYLAFDTDNIEWLFLYPLAVLFLVFYSTHLKKVPLFGNIVVALFCSGVTGVIWIAEMETIQSVTTTLPLLGSKIKTVLIWYMIFAFLATLFREIVKDLQDMEGDLLGNCRTVPISWGVGTAKLLVLGIGGLLLLLLLIQFFALDNIFQRSVLLFSLFVLFIPLCVCFQRIIVASKAKDYWWVSQFIKLILLGGVLLLFFLRL
jgi:4-hydroxybenzoate polyprenyltransferase